jgi:cytoskeletal protein CcmA (bactofilin family)
MAEQAALANNLVIGEGVTFNGSIVAPGKVLISGTVTGQLQADDLQIGKNGKVTGKVQAREIDVHGELNEDIVCKDHILIHSTGKVSGTLEYSELEIQRGGRFQGDMKQK